MYVDNRLGIASIVAMTRGGTRALTYTSYACPHSSV